MVTSVKTTAIPTTTAGRRISAEIQNGNCLADFGKTNDMTKSAEKVMMVASWVTLLSCVRSK